MTKIVLCCIAACIQAGCMDLSASHDDDDAAEVPSEGGQKVLEPGPCSGEACNGQKPYATGCVGDRVIVETRDFPEKRYHNVVSPGGRLVLYRSPSCEASWAVVYRDKGYYSTVWLDTRDGKGLRETVVDYAGRARPTGMLATPLGGLRACVDAIACSKGCDSGPFSTFCTDYH